MGLDQIKSTSFKERRIVCKYIYKVKERPKSTHKANNQTQKVSNESVQGVTR